MAWLLMALRLQPFQSQYNMPAVAVAVTAS